MSTQSQIVLVEEEGQVGQMGLALLAAVSLHGVIVHLARPGGDTLFILEDVFEEAFPKKPEVFRIERVRGGEKNLRVQQWLKNAPLYRQRENPHKGRYANLLEQKEKLRKKLRD